MEILRSCFSFESVYAPVHDAYQWSSFHHRKVLYWNPLFVIFPFYLFLTMILKISSPSPELGISALCRLTLTFPTAPYALAGWPPLISSVGSQTLWLPTWFSQWEAHADEREVGVFVTCLPLYRLWADYGCALLQKATTSVVWPPPPAIAIATTSATALSPFQLFLLLALSDLVVAVAPHWF